jgi:hypothetical protein
MTLSELIDQLTELQQEFPDEDPDVVVAYQPNWPMETQITNAVAVNPMADWEEEYGPEPADGDPDKEAWLADRALTEQKPKSIIVGTAWDNEYLRAGGALALGWR